MCIGCRPGILDRSIGYEKRDGKRCASPNNRLPALLLTFLSPIFGPVCRTPILKPLLESAMNIILALTENVQFITFGLQVRPNSFTPQALLYWLCKLPIHLCLSQHITYGAPAMMADGDVQCTSAKFSNARRVLPPDARWSIRVY